MSRALTLSLRKAFAVSPELAQAIEDYRFTKRIGSESEALRQLIELGLKTALGPNAAKKAKREK